MASNADSLSLTAELKSAVVRFVHKAISVKLLAFATATALAYIGKLPPEMWIIAFATFCGTNISQKLIDSVTSVKKLKIAQ